MRKTVQPRKQRLRAYNAPMHTRGKRIASPLSDELRKKHGKRSLPVRKGDKVEIMRGDRKGHKEVVESIDRKYYKVYVKGLTHKNSKGEDKPIPINASNLRIIELSAVADKRRDEMIARK